MEEFVNITARGVPQKPPLTVEPMEEDEQGREGPEAERTVGPAEGEAIGIMDGVDIMIQESIFINAMLKETVPTSSTQRLLDTKGGVTQEPPSTRPAMEIAEELDAETDAARQEPTSTSEQGTAQTGVSTQSRDVLGRGKEHEVTADAEIDQIGKLFQFSSYFSIPKAARVSRSS